MYDESGILRFRTNAHLVQTFSVDAANQLTTATRSGTLTVSGVTPAPATHVTVNGAGAERYSDFTFAATNQNPGAGSFTVVAQNAPGAGTNTVAVSLPASVAFAYDLNGNLTSDGTRGFAYDHENRLTNITVVGRWKTDFTFDGLGRRQGRVLARSGGGWGNPTNEVRLIYDGYQLVQERNAANQVLATYTRGLDLSGSLDGAGGIGGLLALTTTNGSQPYYYHADGAGNVTALLGLDGNVAARYWYGPFGNRIRPESRG